MTYQGPLRHPPRRFVRSLFLSDIHLGTRACRIDDLLRFIDETEAETIYLVGDIIDGWRLKKKVYWPESHGRFVKEMIRRAQNGVRVVFIPGNHDEIFRPLGQTVLSGITLMPEVEHVTADGRRFLVIHGDQWDDICNHARWLAFLGDQLYECAIGMNRGINAVRRRMGLPYWSFSAWVKLRVKKAVQFISSFEGRVAQEVRQSHVDGVICGHIHHAEINAHDGFLYINTGDWVESCTALFEHHDGRLEILNYLTGQILHEPQRAGRRVSTPSYEPFYAAAE